MITNCQRHRFCDILIGKRPKDFDFTINAIQQQIKIFTKKEVKISKKRKKHEMITRRRKKTKIMTREILKLLLCESMF